MAIVSVSNGLALDAVEADGQVRPMMREFANSSSQRWQLNGTPDGAGYTIQSMDSHMFLTLDEEAEDGWHPWLEVRHGRMSQQWLLALPHGIAEE